MDGIRWLVAIMLVGCGPAVSSADSTGGGDGGGASTAADTPGEVTSGGGTTTDDSAEASGVGVSGEGSTGRPFGTTGDPSGMCPEAIDGLTQLWCGEVDPEGPIAADDDWVYFKTLQDGIGRVPVQGGDVEVIVASAGDVVDLLRHGDNLFWTSFEDGTLGRVGVLDGSPELLADGLYKPAAVAVIEDAAFVTQYGDPYPLLRIALDTGAQSTVYDAVDYGGSIFAWEGRLYFNTSANNGNNQTPLVVGDAAGGRLQTIVTGRWSPNDLEAVDVDPGRAVLWWARYQVEGSGIMQTRLVPGEDDTREVFATPNQPVCVATTAERVYWTEWDNPRKIVRSVTREGEDPQQHLEDEDAGRVVTTRRGVVFPTDGVLLRIDGS